MDLCDIPQHSKNVRLSCLPPELICHISGFLDLIDCHHLKLVCRLLNEKISNIDDILQFRYLDEIKEIQIRLVDRKNATLNVVDISQFRRTEEIAKGVPHALHLFLSGIDNDYWSEVREKLEHLNNMIGVLDKGREYIIKNNPSWYNHYLLIWFCKQNDYDQVNAYLQDPRLDKISKQTFDDALWITIHVGGNFRIMDRLITDPKSDTKRLNNTINLLPL